MGCHGNSVISHNPNRVFLLDKTNRIYLVPVNKLVPMKDCPGSRGQVGLISHRPNINIVFFNWIAIFYPIIVSNDTISVIF